MSTITIDKKSRTESKLYKNLDENLPDTVDEASLPYPEEELITLDEFREYLKKSAYERLGIKLDLSPSNLSTFE